MSLNPQHIGSWRNKDIARIGPAHGVRPVIVSRAGASGSRFHLLSVSQTAGLAANSVRLLPALQLSAAVSGGQYTTGSITRTGGSFIADGWKIGDRLFATGSTTLANDTETIVTAVAALTLTVTAASFTAEALAAGVQLYKGTQVLLVPLAVGAGQTAGTPSLDLLDPAIWKSLDASPDRARTMGPLGATFVALGTAVAAGASNWVDILAEGGDY